MVFYLGKDVSVFLTTENADLGLSPVYSSAGVGSIANGNTATFAAKLNNGGSSVETEQEDLTAVDLSIGAMDEDITYFGMRTALKAEIKKETTLTLTRKKSDALYEIVFDKARYGLKGNTQTDAAALIDGLEQPTINYGYRAYVHLSGTAEVMTIPNCVVSSHSVSINADGTTDETIELTSMVTPVLQASDYVTLTNILDL